MECHAAILIGRPFCQKPARRLPVGDNPPAVAPKRFGVGRRLRSLPGTIARLEFSNPLPKLLRRIEVRRRLPPTNKPPTLGRHF